MLSANLLRVAREQRDVVRHRRRERMMTRVPAVLFLVETEQREIHDPKKVETIGGDGEFSLRLQDLGAVETNLAEDLARVEPLIGGEQDQITLLNRQPRL